MARPNRENTYRYRISYFVLDGGRIVDPNIIVLFFRAKKNKNKNIADVYIILYVVGTIQCDMGNSNRASSETRNLMWTFNTCVDLSCGSSIRSSFYLLYYQYRY